MSKNVIHGTNGGSWSGGHANPTPTVSATPIVTQPPQTPKRAEFTKFLYEGWTIHFQEASPFAWYVDHNCHDQVHHIGTDDENRMIKYHSRKSEHIGVDDKIEKLGENELNTLIRCTECKTILPKYTYLILRRTQKFLLRGKQPR